MTALTAAATDHRRDYTAQAERPFLTPGARLAEDEDFPMTTRDPFVEDQLFALMKAFEIADEQFELADDLKDQRKLMAITDCVAACWGYQDKELNLDVLALAEADGLDPSRSFGSMLLGEQRAKGAVQWRGEAHQPIPIRRKFEKLLAHSTMDAAEFVARNDRARLAEFLHGRPPEQLAAIRDHLKTKGII
jgi:hypothetical protein